MVEDREDEGFKREQHLRDEVESLREKAEKWKQLLREREEKGDGQDWESRYNNILENCKRKETQILKLKSLLRTQPAPGNDDVELERMKQRFKALKEEMKNLERTKRDADLNASAWEKKWAQAIEDISTLQRQNYELTKLKRPKHRRQSSNSNPRSSSRRRRSTSNTTTSHNHTSFLFTTGGAGFNDDRVDQLSKSLGN